MEEKETPKVYSLQCTRCRVVIESHTRPGPKMTCFLCNSCNLKWEEIHQKMLKIGSYEDEVRKAFINFVEGPAHLRNLNF